VWVMVRRDARRARRELETAERKAETKARLALPVVPPPPPLPRRAPVVLKGSNGIWWLWKGTRGW